MFWGNIPACSQGRWEIFKKFTYGPKQEEVWNSTKLFWGSPAGSTPYLLANLKPNFRCMRWQKRTLHIWRFVAACMWFMPEDLKWTYCNTIYIFNYIYFKDVFLHKWLVQCTFHSITKLINNNNNKNELFFFSSQNNMSLSWKTNNIQPWKRFFYNH